MPGPEANGVVPNVPKGSGLAPGEGAGRHPCSYEAETQPSRGPKQGRWAGPPRSHPGDGSTTRPTRRMRPSHTVAMSQEAILEKVRSIVAEQLSVDAAEVKPESNFQNDLGADSLDTVELVMALEEAFDIEIPDEAAEGITTVGDAVKYILDKQA